LLITEVRIRPVHAVGRIKALASVTFDAELVVHDVRIIEGSKGLFVSMPSRRNPGGDYYDVAHPITAEARNILQATVLDAYEHSLEDETESEEARHTGAQESVAQQVPQTETQATEAQASEAQEARRLETELAY